MIWKNFFRDLRRTASRLISVSIITMIAVVVYTGLSGIIYNVDRIMGDYYDAQNVADYWITGVNLDRSDCRALSAVEGITGVQPRVALDAEDRHDSDLTLTLYGVPDFSINTPYIVEGSLPQNSREIFLSDGYAAAHGLEVGDWYEITLTGLGVHLRLQICGVGKDPECLYNINATNPSPDLSRFAFAYVNEEVLSSVMGANQYTQICITTADGGEQVYSLPANTTFAPGKKYSFAISTEPFGDKTVEDAAVGDYYMADGTVLGQDKTLTPELASKVVGIVFYEGHHDLDNSDYTNTGIGQQKCHGYAVALTDVHNDTNDGLRWEKGPSGEYNRRVGTSINNDWNGYSNSQKFHDFVNDEENKAEGWEMKHFPAANACETYGNRTLDKDGNDANGKYDWQQSLAAPKNSSGWFLPSYGQLSHLGEKREIELLSTRMNDVKNSISADCDYKDYIKWFSSGSYYWSSTEHPDDTHIDKAMCVCVSIGFLGVYTKNYTRDVRAVLAF